MKTKSINFIWLSLMTIGFTISINANAMDFWEACEMVTTDSGAGPVPQQVCWFESSGGGGGNSNNNKDDRNGGGESNGGSPNTINKSAQEKRCMIKANGQYDQCTLLGNHLAAIRFNECKDQTAVVAFPEKVVTGSDSLTESIIKCQLQKDKSIYSSIFKCNGTKTPTI